MPLEPPPDGQYWYDGETAANIMQWSRQCVLDTVTAALEAADYTIGTGDGEFQVFRSFELASKRYKSGQPFIYVARMPSKPTPTQVLAEGEAHSAKCYRWRYVVQVGAGTNAGKTPAEATALADEELMDLIRQAFEDAYVDWRDRLHFERLTVAPQSSAENGAKLNPITLEFYSVCRMAADEFITVP